jgi:uncharacterized protein YciI
MFVMLARYKVPAEEVDRHLDGHRAWIMKHVEAGRFHVTGREVPLVGGIIIASAESVEELRDAITEDPFYTSGSAEYEIREFDVVRTTPELEGLKALNRAAG